jgi:hypothetical protein
VICVSQLIIGATKIMIAFVVSIILRLPIFFIKGNDDRQASQHYNTVLQR